MCSLPKTALVVEGGGMRGIFSAGVLDAFYEEDFTSFDLFLGVSAGACNLASFLSGQKGRCYRVFAIYSAQKKFIRLGRYFSGGHVMDLDWLWEILQEADPLDAEKAIAHGKEFVVVATCVRTGRPLYLQPSADNLNRYLKASSAVPVLYRGPVTVSGKPAVDGGVSDAIPVKEAWRRGAKRIAVVRTQPTDYEKENPWEAKMASWLLRKTPAVAEAVRSRSSIYNEALLFMENPPDDIDIVQIAPPKPLATGRTTQDVVALNEDYQQGLSLGKKSAQSLKKLWDFHCQG